ncbi:hypothetical protein C8J56DRAFT_851966 [Mycena floridula]|nr:hypothetical protein C8J56DRAFT_851966 [Mycena floridula]
MANIDKESTSSSELISATELVPQNLVDGTELSNTGNAELPAIPTSFAAGEAEQADSTAVPLPDSSVSTIKPTLVQLGSSSAAAPQPKRFSAVNINKKFLEKNSSASGSAPTSTSSSIAKSGSPASRPQIPATSATSRLVTTKLTAAPQPSTSTGPGWSRPSSATPPVATGSSSPTHPSGSSQIASGTSSTPAAHVSKLIQPQPKNAMAPGALRDMGSGSSKPVWGNVKSAATRADTKVQNDFPTAAEVAQVSKTKLAESMEAAQAAAASEQARMVEADTFRGVHLDPNAHHWDEMEEDDDNFLDGVIEFGDGRQYKIESTEPPRRSPSPPTPASRSHSRLDDARMIVPGVAVTKEERLPDDFDRSWPRSRTSPRVPIRDLAAAAPPHVPKPASNAGSISPATTSPSEPSRVLFNERSNRLEPYNNSRQSSFHKRPGQPEHPPVDPRGRDNMQLLQKGAGADMSSRSRGYSGTSDRRDREPHASRRDSFTSSHPPQSPRLSFANAVPPQSAKEREFDTRGRRNNTMGPPPVPPGRRSSRDQRQVPPHLAQVVTTSGSIRGTSRESRPPSSAGPPTQSPALSHASAVTISPVLASAGLQSGADLDEMRKDVMQTAAARAKQRRQQEEEQREKERERARKKAAEMEEKMEQERALKLQAEAEVEKAVNSVIEEAVKSAENSVLDPALHRTTSKPPLRRTPSTLTLATGEPPARRSIIPPTPVSAAVSSTVDSWRSKANPLPPPPEIPPSSARLPNRPTSVSFVAPPPSVLEQSLAEEPGAELEVVDFTDMGKFVGVPEDVAPPSPVKLMPSRPSRPTASDFFDDRPSGLPTPLSSGDLGPWRSNRVVASPSLPAEEAKVSTKEVAEVSSTVEDSPSQVVIVPVAPPVTQRTPRSQAFNKEASMSALDDAMSRIRGAINVMQASDKESQRLPLTEPDNVKPSISASSLPLKPSAPKERWVPPSLRPRPIENEVFAVTGCDPPRSPKLAWNNFVVNLPKISSPVEPLTKRQAGLFLRTSTIRFDILTFEPPVEGMNKRDLSLNDVLFPRIAAKRKFHKFTVSLPKARLVNSRIQVPPTLKVNGAFGRPTLADGASSWRKPVTPKTESSSVLETTSRSPPPSDTSESQNLSRTDASGLALTPVRSRSQPKMPAGSSVAFYRDSKVVEVESDAMPLVSFIVTSELEESKQNAQQNSLTPSPATSSTLSQSSPNSTKTLVNGVKSPSVIYPSLTASGKSESKAADDSTDLTASHHAWARTSITKESPARGPDPEHLKAVWSQTSTKSEMQPVNSLEGIADDLTAIPFTLQDVKSEDGETPPPSLPSRMSLHDVTRAFQQVPSSSSSSSSSLRPTISPPSTTAPVARPPTATPYAYPVPTNQNFRPTYAPYPGQMMGHSPGPMMYPMNGSPIPARMPINGHPQMYPQQVWMPLPNSTPQNPMGMMRPMPSPYPGHLLPYPSPGSQPMYMPQLAPNMQNGQQNGTPNRGRGMNSAAMMSPLNAHAGPVPMYASSPVLMHAGRVQPVRNDSHPGQQQQQQPSNQHSQPYNGALQQSNSFGRPAW